VVLVVGELHPKTALLVVLAVAVQAVQLLAQAVRQVRLRKVLLVV
jgi:hypothetical protein